MKDVSKQKTIALISHGGAGKTSLAEAFLFLTKVTSRLGSVVENTSVLDYEPEEIKRKNSLGSSFHSFPWKKHQITFVDTPGGENFLNDTRTVLYGVDAALVLVDAVDMVKVSTEKGWSYADSLKLPRLVVINKMDRERADFYKTLENINESFTSPKAVPVALPIGNQDTFTGLVDLLNQKAYTYDSSGKANEGPIPADMTDLVAEYREKLIEAISESDDALLEKFLEGEEIPLDQLESTLKKAIFEGHLAPVTPASGIKLIGLSNLLDLIVFYLPSPIERGQVGGHPLDDPTGDLNREPDPSAP
jgi:elongation factor G